MNVPSTVLLLFAVLTTFLAVSVVVWQLNEYSHQISVESCNSCLTDNKIPCTSGNCTEYKETVNDCCPQCWVDLEGMVES